MASKKYNIPLKFDDPVELQRKIDEYFKECDETNRPYTITGLAYYLDTCRETLLFFENEEHSDNNISIDRDIMKQVADTIKKAKLKIHIYAEEYLFKGKNQVGCIFNLKNNWGWQDKQIVETKTTESIDELDESELNKILDKIEKMKKEK